jgi:hypothetical protein
MSDTGSGSSGGVGCFGVVMIVFLTLKLSGVIDWSWWWVMAPVWVPASLALLLLGFLGVIHDR